MSAILKAMSSLEKAVTRLEKSAQNRKSNSVLDNQPDMFSAPANHNGSSVNPEVIAKRLNKAIETVESVLSEA